MKKYVIYIICKMINMVSPLIHSPIFYEITARCSDLKIKPAIRPGNKFPRFIRGLITALIICAAAAPSYAIGISINMRFGYSPHAGGTMSSEWQAANLGVYDGLNGINRSSDAFDVSTVEVPIGITGALDLMFYGEVFYFKTGIWSLYTVSGGTGKTIDPAEIELVSAEYSQWSVDVPVTIGVNLVYWGESRIYMGCGFAFAYGMSTMTFSSASAAYDHSAVFPGYAIPLVAELGCEYMTGDHTSVGCGIRYMYGKSAIIEKSSDSAVVDFSGYIFTMSASYHFRPGGPK